MNKPIELPKIDNAFMQLYLQNADVESLFANSEGISGEFFLEGLDIRIAISDSELEEVLAAQEILIAIKTGHQQSDYTTEQIEKAKLINATFMQAHNHELAHLYQVLALPAFQMVWATRYNLLRLEATVMLRLFEQGGYFESRSHRKILQVLDDKNYGELIREFADVFNDLGPRYELYIVGYRQQYDGISLFYIIESMAHIISLQLSDTPEQDILKLGIAQEYSAAFAHFDRYLNEIEIELRWKHLVFLYICYFSCQHFNAATETSANVTVTTFFRLCSNARFYLDTLVVQYRRYAGVSKTKLIEINRWPIPKKELGFATHKQLVSIYAMFELIDILETQAFSAEPQKELSVDALADFFNVSENKNIDWRDKYTLARMLIFPANFVWTRDIYDEVMGLVGPGKDFNYSQEAEFYRFITMCKHLLNPARDVLCCQMHGMRDQRQKILRCKNEDSLAFHLKALTDKSAYDLFKF